MATMSQILRVVPLDLRDAVTADEVCRSLSQASLVSSRNAIARQLGRLRTKGLVARVQEARYVRTQLEIFDPSASAGASA